MNAPALNASAARSCPSSAEAEASVRLSDLVGLTPGELATRKAFLELTDEDARILVSLQPALQGDIDAIVDEFYAHLLRFAPLAAMLSDPDALRHLRALQRRYFLELIDGRYDGDYAERRLRVGQAHERAGLEPKWYLGAYNRYFRLAARRIAAACGGDAARQLRAVEALSKVLFLDIALALDTYIARAQHDLQRRADELSALYQLAATANASLDLLTVLNSGLDRTLAAMGTGTGMLFLLDESGRELVLKVHRGLSTAFIDASARIPLGVRIPGRVAQTGEPVVLDDADLQAAPGASRLAPDGVRSLMCVPLRARGRTLGVIHVFDRRRARFAPADLRFLTSIADTLGIAVENARLYTETRQVAAVGELAASIAHEIKNPLAGISCALQVIGETAPPEDARRPVIDEVLAQVRRLDRTVRDLLMFARPLSPQPAPVALAETVDWVRANLRSSAGFARLRITLEVGPGAGRVSADAQLLRDVLLNLFMNAVDAMPDGGAIAVRARREAAMIAVEVRDTGAGIAPEVLERLFRPFFTTKTRGTGLGLSICRKILEVHGGRIEVASEPGKGTAVTLHLPAA